MVDSDALLKELLETFQLEAQDHIRALSTLLVALEKEGEPAERRRLLETIFRRMHTLKGAAHAVNLLDVAQTCQELESLLSDLKRGEIQLDLSLFDRLHADVDALSASILTREERASTDPGPREAAPRLGAKETGPPSSSGRAKVQGKAEGSAGINAGAGGPGEAEPARPGREAAEAPEPERRAPPSGSTPAGDTVRVSTRLLASLLLQAEELVSAKLTASVLLEEMAAAAAEFTGRSKERARALESAREALRHAKPGDQAARLAALLQSGCESERLTESRLRSLEKSTGKHLWSLRGMIDPLQEDMKKLHLLPFSFLTEPFSKTVRDMARELDKEAELSCSGGELEIDRRILSELKEPLLHIMRNVMDHGIEKAPARRLLGKPDKGNITIAVRLQDGNRAEITVADDGRGIDPAEVKGAALRLELLAPEEAERISDAEALQLIFESGFSTSPIITSISGRGVGLAIVRESLERLGGHVTVESRPGEGTEFRLCLPLSFAMLRALLVETAGRAALIPAANVDLTFRVAKGEILSVENRDTVLVAGEVTPLVNLARLLELSETGAEQPDGFQPVVVLSGADKRIAFAVDRVLEVQEILMKPLGSQLPRVRNVAGATVLGNGQVVPILNIGDLFRSALLSAGSGASPPQTPARPKPKRLSVLVAEDSITSRTLLKNILESSGFLVRTAIDGADAISQLKTESFDIVVSDVEMPRMDGFQLTAAIREDKRLAAIPVILVTGLESRQDRERGIEVGANAYIVKSSFDQSSLIEVIHKLT